MSLAALHTHGMLEVAQAIAEQHGTTVEELLAGGAGARELAAALRGEGWSARNIERVFGLAERRVDDNPEQQEDDDAPRRGRRTPAPPAVAAGETTTTKVRPAGGQGARPAPHPVDQPRDRLADVEPRRDAGSNPARGTEPMPAVHLPVLPVTELSSPADWFRCVPFAATITAGTCIARQHAADPARRDGLPVGRAMVAGAANRAFGRCRNCELGRGVASRLKGVLMPLASTKGAA